MPSTMIRRATLITLTIGTLAAPLAAQDELAPYTDLAERLEESLSKCDPAVLEASFDLDLLIQRSMRGLELPATDREEFREGFASSFAFGKAICMNVGEGGSYKLLRLREVEGKPRALFRMLPVSGGVNYHDLLLARLPGDRIRVIDAFVYLSGEWLSETVRRAVLPLIVQRDQNILERLIEGESAYLANLDLIQEVSQRVMAGQFQAALDAYAKLPPEVQRDKTLMMSRFTAASRLEDDTAYNAALNDFKKLFPDDPSIQFLLIDYYVLRKDYATALEIVDRIEKAVGGDPFLHNLRANIVYGTGRLDEARQHAYQAIREEPELEEPYWVVVTLALDQERHKEAASFLGALEERFGVELPDLTAVPAYAKFVKSDVYRDWMAQRRKRGGD